MAIFDSYVKLPEGNGLDLVFMGAIAFQKYNVT